MMILDKIVKGMGTGKDEEFGALMQSFKEKYRFVKEVMIIELEISLRGEYLGLKEIWEVKIIWEVLFYWDQMSISN